MNNEERFPPEMRARIAKRLEDDMRASLVDQNIPAEYIEEIVELLHPTLHEAFETYVYPGSLPDLDALDAKIDELGPPPGGTRVGDVSLEDAAAASGCTVRQLQFWYGVDMVRPSGTFGQYTEGDIATLRFVREQYALGVDPKDVRRALAERRAR